MVKVETQAAFLNADENHDEVQRDVGFLAVEAQEEAVHPEG
ncbi:MAG TPA: hypothetical protein VMR02_16440 [Terracidiphilus sp.]|jgi:hypothetical protein|nr:hypothetical protein [Terracidiphilus sp.]